MSSEKIYFIHDNRDRPFKVQIENDNIIYVYKKDGYDEEKGKYTYDLNPYATFDTTKIFIGKSPFNKMTEYSGGYGPEFDGNTILFESKINEYVHIGSEIFSFETKYPIKEYISPVGNNDVPYPYAIDTQNNIYLIIFKVIILDNDNVRKILSDYDNPNDYYQYYSLITPNRGTIPQQEPKINFKDIDTYLIGHNKYTLKYEPFPAKNYDRLTKYGKKKMFIIDKQTNRYRLKKIEYVMLMNEFGKLASFEPLIVKETYSNQNIGNVSYMIGITIFVFVCALCEYYM